MGLLEAFAKRMPLACLGEGGAPALPPHVHGRASPAAPRHSAVAPFEMAPRSSSLHRIVRAAHL